MDLTLFPSSWWFFIWDHCYPIPPCLPQCHCSPWRYYCWLDFDWALPDPFWPCSVLLLGDFLVIVLYWIIIVIVITLIDPNLLLFPNCYLIVSQCFWWPQTPLLPHYNYRTWLAFSVTLALILLLGQWPQASSCWWLKDPFDFYPKPSCMVPLLLFIFLLVFPTLWFGYVIPSNCRPLIDFYSITGWCPVQKTDGQLLIGWRPVLLMIGVLLMVRPNYQAWIPPHWYYHYCSIRPIILITDDDGVLTYIVVDPVWLLFGPEEPCCWWDPLPLFPDIQFILPHWLASPTLPVSLCWWTIPRYRWLLVVDRTYIYRCSPDPVVVIVDYLAPVELTITGPYPPRYLSG